MASTLAIYQLTNMITGDRYIGQTNNFYRRMIQHKYLSGGSRLKLYRAIKKYGWDNFDKKKLFECPEYLVDGFEQMLIKGLREDVGKIYNLDNGGQTGHKHSDTTKSKLSKSKMGRLNPRYGKPAHPNQLASIRKGTEHPFYGKHHNENSKDKISLAKSKYKDIVVVDKQGKVTGEYKTIRDIEKDLGVTKSNVIRCINGERKTHLSYKYFLRKEG